jgi:GTP-binding protein Era
MVKNKKKSGTKHVSGFVSILGRPNAGKSTLLNTLAGTKVAIVSSKPQTTRSSIQAVLTMEGAQVVFVDTPGVHESPVLLHRKMMESVREALRERDLLLWMADATRGFDPADVEAAKILEGQKAPKYLVLNKIDRIADKQQLLPLLDQYRQTGLFAEFFPVSALGGEGTGVLKSAIIKALPEGPQYFPPDFLTDQPERHLAGELIREQVLHETQQEVPHAVAVLVEKWEDGRKLLRIAATVYVEREGQKKIVIGAGGATLKKIATQARIEMERLFGKKVFLEVFVKVKAKWRESAEFLKEIDWRIMAGGEEK